MFRPVLLVTVLAVGLLAGPPLALAEPPPDQLWSEKRWVTPIDPDAPISMRAFSRLARELSPAVVNINVRRRGARLPSIFGGPGGGTGLGTGFIIHKDGYVLTNNHVIKDTDEIQVKLANEHAYPARVVGTYAQLDVALLKFDADEALAVAPLGDSDALEIGEWVIAIGNPFGLNHTVTAGIVSAKGRRDVITRGEPMYAQFIQTDASINPGNSGGPLINIRGEVVGINTAINAAGQGIGFAVPVNMIKTILPQLATGKVSRSYLGVRVGPVARELATRLKMSRVTGALVREVLSGTPADVAGVQAGDVILEWGGVAVEHWEDLPWLASTASDGQRVVMVVNRSGKELRLDVRPTAFPEDPVAATHRSPRGATGSSIDDVGLSFGPVTPEVAKPLGLKTGEGVLVTGVTSGSPADQVGVEAGDVITQINYEPVTGGPAAFEKAVGAIARGDILAFTIRRDDRFLFKAFAR